MLSDLMRFACPTGRGPPKFKVALKDWVGLSLLILFESIERLGLAEQFEVVEQFDLDEQSGVRELAELAGEAQNQASLGDGVGVVRSMPLL